LFFIFTTEDRSYTEVYQTCVTLLPTRLSDFALGPGRCRAGDNIGIPPALRLTEKDGDWVEWTRRYLER
ncbi:MAG: hypothetical protein ABIQ93_03640, partial [Saprospiraceae bacterium]